MLISLLCSIKTHGNDTILFDQGGLERMSIYEENEYPHSSRHFCHSFLEKCSVTLNGILAGRQCLHKCCLVRHRF